MGHRNGGVLVGVHAGWGRAVEKHVHPLKNEARIGILKIQDAFHPENIDALRPQNRAHPFIETLRIKRRVVCNAHGSNALIMRMAVRVLLRSYRYNGLPIAQ